MSQIVRTFNVCDKDGCEQDAPHRHSFSFGGKERVLDLCEQHQAQAVAVVRPWLDAAIVIKPARRKRP